MNDHHDQPETTNISTEGGSVVQGNVHVSGGNFAGRDMIIQNVHQVISAGDIKDDTATIRSDTNAILEQLSQMNAGIQAQNRRSAVTEGILADTITQLSDKLTEKELSEARTAWREGRKEEAVEWIQKTRLDTNTWVVLSEVTRAELLCFEGSLSLDSGEIDRAKHFLAEARQLATSAQATRLEALIHFCTLKN